ncbi:MAG: exodeoxyribonuclease V subunit alpha [Desulfobacterales bacterium]
MRSTDLTSLYRSGQLAEIDVHFADFVDRLGGHLVPDLALAAALVSRAAAAGHVCLDLKALDRVELLEAREGRPTVNCPAAEDWMKRLRASPVVGCPGNRRPLILDPFGRLYLYRYWSYEQELIDAINRRTGGNLLPADRDPAALRKTFERLFPEDGLSDRINWQKIAALAVLLKRFCIITGGPGTGKTHTVAKILALLIEQADGAPIDIMLAAPTGKAAAKLGESLKSARGSLNCSPAVRERLPIEARTIHRMLQPVFGTSDFRYNAANLLPADVVIVDEASMVDLALLSKLVAALGDRARLLLIGDKDQLASVEAGAVLGDICDRGRPHRFSQSFSRTAEQATGISMGPCGGEDEEKGGLRDSIVNLVRSYRFEEKSGIGALSSAVNLGNGDAVLDLLKTGHDDGVQWKPVASPHELYRQLPEHILEGYRDSFAVDEPRRALERFSRFRVLCAVNKGFYGVAAINRLAEQVLRRSNLIATESDRTDRWYAGRPVLVTANDYRLGLFNGDIGLAVAAEGAGEERLVVCFEDAGGDMRRIPIHRLPVLETVFAMTVHKSQGSEFDQVHLILPDTDVPVLTRELIYTAVTRARSRVTIWGQERILAAAISRRIVRRSGLRDALWGRGECDDDKARCLLSPSPT